MLMRRVAGVVLGVGLVLASAAAAAPVAAAGAARVPDAVPSAATTATGGSYRPPVPGALTRRFDPPAVPWGRGHRGVDLAAEPGDEVRSPGPGVVTFAGAVAGRGVVTVRHPDGLRSSLEPVAVAVRVGDEVATGRVLGTLEAGGTHLGVHWGVRDAAGYRDPLGLLPRAGPVVLLPVP